MNNMHPFSIEWLEINIFLLADIDEAIAKIFLMGLW